VSRLIAVCGHSRARIAGHDWGAAVAWWTALRFPAEVERLAILNVPHPIVMRRQLRHDREQRRRSWYMFFFQLPWLPELAFSRRGFAMGEKALVRTSRRGTFLPADLAVYHAAWREPGAVRAMIHWYRAALRRPPARLPSVRVTPPALVLWGEKDRFLGREMVAPSLALCDDGRLETFPEASHWLQHEEPRAVNRRLIAHFSAGLG
jgi:epoxide hydrolase 4